MFERSKSGFKANAAEMLDYKNCIKGLMQNTALCGLHNYNQHANVTRLEHSLHVSYKSYMLCRRLGLDYYSAARGGLLHDFFLYDRRAEKPYKGLHAMAHPNIALKNANKYFVLNDLEKDIIQKHMWPLTILPPRYPESFLVSCIDKYCAILEFFSLGRTFKNMLLVSPIEI